MSMTRFRTTTPFEDRFERDRKTGCWNWLMHKDDRGYGYIKPSVEKSPQPAYRWTYEQLVGPIPEGLVIDHICENNGCINPMHLQPVTQAENVQRAARTKLTEDDVRKIRRLREEGKGVQFLSDKFGIHNSHVSRICNYESWSNVA